MFNLQYLGGKKEQKNKNIQRKNRKIILKVDLNTDISITTLNVNDLKVSIKREVVRLDLKNKIKLYAIYKNPL